VTTPLPEPDPHLKATIAKLSDAELRPLMASMLQRLVMTDGPAFTGRLFPSIGRNWVDPFQAPWP
jgi:hypothetical protein